MAASDFGSRALLQVQRYLVETPIQPRKRQIRGGPPETPKYRSRRYINDVVGRVRQMFRWGVLQELVPDDRIKAMEIVPALACGKTAAPELEPRDAVPDAVIEKTLPHLTREVADLVVFLRRTGCRPSEASRMRLADILDRDQPVWRYVPKQHKTKHRGKRRDIAIGPDAQRIIQARAAGCQPEEPIFSPRRSVPTSKTIDVISISPRRPSPRVGERFTKDALRIAIARAAEAAGVPHWTPYQLRYTRLQEIRREQGREAVQATAGHSRAEMSDHYAPAGWERAEEAALRSG